MLRLFDHRIPRWCRIRFRARTTPICVMPRARQNSIRLCWCRTGAGDAHHLGLVPTLSVTDTPPFLLARLVNSLDHVTGGRIGWNCVTSSNDGAAQNYGHVGQPPRDRPYDLADEFADLVTRLWDAWEPDAVVIDRDAPMFADGRKVHPVNFEGKYFRCRGPLNAPRSPQGRPPICTRQAGRRAGRNLRRAGLIRSSPMRVASRP